MNTWRTQADGRVAVEQGRGPAFPSLDAAETRLFEAKVRPWTELAESHARAHGVPLSWVLGVIFAESGGNAKAGPNAKGFGGLMAISAMTIRVIEPGSARVATTDLHDPTWNAHIGTAYLAKLRNLAGTRGADLPTVASMYNAGQQASGAPWPSSKSPWGMRENEGYISRVVRASNYALERRAGRPLASAAAGAGAGLALVALAWLAWEAFA